ncbi:MAG TPA: hypothetical protein VJ775_01820 [Sphingomicrobium sp.]|nr:hypothetical protein [Sphingomicrobium sp.]
MTAAMASGANRTGSGWGTRLIIAIALILAGAIAAAWGLARYDQAARFLGITPAEVPAATPQRAVAVPRPTVQSQSSADAQRIAELESRLSLVERSTQRVEGSAGRADALLVAFAARRAVDRGVALGFLEPLLVDRFGQIHPGAVATIITGSHSPVQLNELITEYRTLGPQLRSSAPEDGWWTQFKRELGSLVKIRQADRPSTQPDARYQRALAQLEDGEVDAALAETMRLPGAARAQPWVRKARQYVAIHRALDEVESAALLGKSGSPAS